MEWVMMYACQHETSQGADWVSTVWRPESEGQYTIQWIGRDLPVNSRVSVTSLFTGQNGVILLNETRSVPTPDGLRETFYWSDVGRTPAGTGEGSISWSYSDEYFWDRETGVLVLYRSSATSPDGDTHGYTQTLDSSVLTVHQTKSLLQKGNLTNVIAAATSTSSLFTEPKTSSETHIFESAKIVYSTIVVAAAAIMIVMVGLSMLWSQRRKSAPKMDFDVLLQRLETLRESGAISDSAYTKLRQDYERRRRGD
jgi:hypothetical protein